MKSCTYRVTNSYQLSIEKRLMKRSEDRWLANLWLQSLCSCQILKKCSMPKSRLLFACFLEPKGWWILKSLFQASNEELGVPAPNMIKIFVIRICLAICFCTECPNGTVAKFAMLTYKLRLGSKFIGFNAIKLKLYEIQRNVRSFGTNQHTKF